MEPELSADVLTPSPPSVSRAERSAAPSQRPMTRETRGLDRSLARGIAWIGGVRWLSMLGSWCATLVVARLVTPTDYGLFAMAMVYIGFVELVNELGLNVALVQRRELSEDQIAQLGGMAVLAGIGFCALSVGVSGLVAGFFGEPVVGRMIGVLSFSFVARSVQVVPRALLARALDFRRLAWISAVESWSWSLVALAGAAVGLGYWAFVTGVVVSGVVATAVLLRWRPHRIAWPRDVHAIAGVTGLGWLVVIAQVCWFVYDHADLTLVGRWLGKAALGGYAKASDVADVPVDRISSLVGQVTPGVFAAAQSDVVILRRYLLGLSEGLALVTFPMSLGLALVADVFVLAVLGEGWRSAIVPLRLLGLLGGLRSILNVLPQMLIATGHAKLNAQCNVIMAAGLTVALYIGTHWGLTGVSIAWLVGYPVFAIPTFFRRTLRILDISAREYLRILWPATSAAAGVAVAVLALRAMTPPTWSPQLRLVLYVVAGATTYLGILFTAHGSRMKIASASVIALRRTGAVA
jgi:teichuronic acid exporter